MAIKKSFNIKYIIYSIQVIHKGSLYIKDNFEFLVSNTGTLIK